MAAGRFLRRFLFLTKLPSIDKGRHGFDGQKCAHTASSPLEIRQVFPAGLSLPGHISARKNCFAPASDGFPSDFRLLSRRRAGARQGEKDKKRRKGALAGVFALVNRWYKGKKTADLYRSAGRDLFFIILTHPPQNSAADNGCFHDNT